MELDEVERLLEQGGRVGFIKPTNDPNYLGWILLWKVKANQRLLEILDEADDPIRVKEERRRQREPYLLLRIELKRSVHEAGDYETEKDYRQKDKFWFSSLDDVEKHLVAWGYSLKHARPARELDAP